MMLKIDMAKAYDRVDWGFLLEVLHAFSFSNNFCKIIDVCVKSPWFSVIMNGTYKGYFQASQGLRHGDPLSPYLFIVMEEVLTRLLKKNFATGRIGTFSHPVGAPLVSHLLYADDLLVFANGQKKSIKSLMDTLATYEKWSGQKISKEKSAIFMSKLINNSRRLGLLRITGFKEGTFPVTYLGAPLFLGRLTSRMMEPLVDNIWKNVVGWKFKLLSQGGRLILVRHVLSSMPIHLLSVLSILLMTISRINSIMANFLWGEAHDKRKVHWRAWQKVCKPTKEGGLGIRDLKEIQRSLHMKFAFRLLTASSLWAEFFKAKYVRNGHLMGHVGRHQGSKFWKSIKSNLPKVMDNSRVIVRGGNSSFWYDRWLASGPLAVRVEEIQNATLCIRECWDNNSWNIDLLTDLVGETVTADIVHLGLRIWEGLERWVWESTTDGSFSIAMAWDRIRDKADLLPWPDWVWNSFLSKKVSLCVWRAWFNGLSVDDRVRKKGVSLASTCDCCSQKKQENVGHVLSSGQFARFGLVRDIFWAFLVCSRYRCRLDSQLGSSVLRRQCLKD